jgi:hypothetical protein
MGFYLVAVYYNKTQHTNNTHHTNNTPHSNKHSTQNYTNNKGHTTYCGVAPGSPLLANGYAPNSSFIGNDYNGMLPRNLIGDISKQTVAYRNPLTKQWNPLSNNRTVGSGVLDSVRPGL